MSRIIDDDLCLQLSATEAHIPSVAKDMGNPLWEKSSARILILRLSPFRDVEGSTAHLVLFAECRKALPEAYIDFGFFPDRRDRAILSARGLPFFYGLESGRGPVDFDLVLVSNAFSLELVNLSYLYSSSGIPRRASERNTEDTAAEDTAISNTAVPIIILGGSNAAAAGALLFPDAGPEERSDSLVDGIFFGEGESAIGVLAAALTLSGSTRAKRLKAASVVEGFWRPLSGEKASKKILRPYPPHLTNYPIFNSAGAATAKLQISAGCPGFCSFCLEGWESRPYRELPVAEIAKAARELKAATGASDLEVYSYNFNTHAEIFELILELNRIFRRVNFMSQRLDVLAESPALASAELAAGKRSFTLGIEGISDRMRRYYRKGIEARQIDEAIGRLSLPAVREIKLFYILAGAEEDRDIVEFAAFAARTAETRRRAAPGQRIIVSAGYLVRLPFTPLQYAPLCLDRDRLEGIARRVEGACAAAGLEFRLAANFEEYYCDQLLALGGRRLAPWLEATPEAGISYDGGLSRGTGPSLENYARDLLDEAFMGEKGGAWRPPLAFVDENDEALRKNYLLASSFAPTKSRIESPPSPDAGWIRRLERLMAAKRGFASTLVRVSLPPSLAWATEEYRSSWLMRALGASSEGSASVFDAEEALFGKGEKLEGMADRFWGIAYYRLRGPDSGRMAKAAKAAGFEVMDALPACERIEAEAELPGLFAKEAESTLKAWLAEERVGFIESRAGSSREAGSRRLSPSERDLKKRILFEAELTIHDPGAGSPFEAKLRLGPKAKLASWFSRMGYAARRSVSLRILGYGE
ncbi:MAG: radical SAM protein [Rectinemataceae bacterium]